MTVNNILLLLSKTNTSYTLMVKTADYLHMRLLKRRFETSEKF